VTSHENNAPECAPETFTPAQIQLFERLNALGIETRTVSHAATFTVEESSAIDKALPGGHTKNLFLKCKKGGLYLIVAQSDTEIRLNQLHKAIGSGRLSFGKPELLIEVLGVEPGSVTPFALINDIEVRVSVILDRRMMIHNFLNYHPLKNTATTNIARDDLLRFIEACGHRPRVMALTGE